MQKFFKQIIRFFLAWLALVSLCYFFVRALPGQEFHYDLPSDHPANLQLLTNGLRSESWFMGWFSFLKNLFTGNLGKSPLFDQASISEVIWPSLKVTFEISFISFFVISCAIYFALFFAWRSHVLRKILLQVFSVLAQIPLIVWAPALIYFLSLKLKLLPAALLLTPAHFVLPILVLSIRPISQGFLLMLDEMKDLDASDVIRFAIAKGLTRHQIFSTHILRLLMPRYITFFLPTMANLLSGSLLVEFLFAINGLGFLFYRAFESRDLQLVSAICIVTGSYFLFLKFVAELLVSVFEPRSEFTIEGQNG